MTRAPSRGRRVLQGLCVSMGLVTALCLLMVLADVSLLIVLTVEKAHNAWYFPYSVFVLPVLLVSGPTFFFVRRALRHRGVGRAGS